MILLACNSDGKQTVSNRIENSLNGNSEGRKNLNMKEDSEKEKKSY